MPTATGERSATDAAASLTPAGTSTVETMESDVPTIETAAYQRTVKRLERNRDVYHGTEAIQAKGVQYLPQFRGESDTLYDARRTISSVFNGYARTVEAIYGIVCEPEPTLADDMPQELKDMAENVTGDGVHLAVFTRRLVENAVVDGFDGILTEYPRLGDPRIDLTKASLAAKTALETNQPLDLTDVQALGLRPYFILVKVDECLPIYESVNGRKTLVMFIRRQVTAQTKGRFGMEPVVRYYVYELIGSSVYFERWTESNGQRVQDITPTLMRGLTAIPWSPLPLGKKLGEHEYRPLLDDLAFLTLTHHRIATGILSLEEQACVVTPYRVGVKPDGKGKYPELVLGPSNTIEIPPPPAGVSLPAIPVGYLSPPVDVLEPAMKSLENCKAEMGAMGASFLAPQPVQETATAKRMDDSAQAASIATISRDVKDCLESAFGFAGQYVGKKGGSITMNNDFVGDGVNAQVLAILVTNYQSDRPIVTLEDVRHYLKTGQLPEGFDPDDTLGLLTITAQNARDKANAQRDMLALAAGGQGGTSGDGGADA
jgi:hypothetical protein